MKIAPDALNTVIGKKFVFLAIVIGTVFAFFATIAQLFWEYRVARNQANERLVQIEIQHAPLLSQTLWILDDQLIKVHLASILAIPDVISLELTQQGGPHVILGQPTESSSPYLISHDIELSHQRESQIVKIGTLTVVLSLKPAIAGIFRRAIFVLAINFLKTLIVAVFLLIVFQHLIGRHLHGIAQALDRNALLGNGGPLKLNRQKPPKKDELDILVDAYNSAISSLHEALFDLEKSNKELMEAKENAEEMNSAKTFFLANISHELRTPLAALVGFLELTNNSPDLPSDKKAHYFQRMIYNASILQNLVEELLDISRIESGAVKVNYEVVETRTYFDGFVREFENEIARKGIDVGVSFAHNVPDTIRKIWQRHS